MISVVSSFPLFSSSWKALNGFLGQRQKSRVVCLKFLMLSPKEMFLVGAAKVGKQEL